MTFSYDAKSLNNQFKQVSNTVTNAAEKAYEKSIAAVVKQVGNGFTFDETEVFVYKPGSIALNTTDEYMQAFLQSDLMQGIIDSFKENIKSELKVK